MSKCWIRIITKKELTRVPFCMHDKNAERKLCNMNYEETRKYLESVNKLGSILGLKTIRNLLLRLNNPEKDLKVVHVAGTNGKGSTSAFLQNILAKSGYRVGVFSSPAVFEKREIIRINDEFIKEEELAQIVTEVKIQCDDMVADGMAHPTVFEVETAAALLYFKSKKCDVVIMECGMGGKTDATNICEKVLCSVITTIGLDHTQYLGDTIEEIAEIKAGIIKDNCPVVMSRQSSDVTEIVRNKAVETHSELIISNEVKDINSELVINNEVKDINSELVMSNERKDVIEHTDGRYVTNFTYVGTNNKKYHISLKTMGIYQVVNATTAIEAAIILSMQGFNVDDYIELGLQEAFWPGRMEVICNNPLVVIDGGHNPDAIKKLKESIDLYFTNKKITFIMGVLADKDFRQEAKIIAGMAEKIITVTPDNPRALDSEQLAESVSLYNKNTVSANTLEEAVKLAISTVESGNSDMIIAFGSLSYLKELKTLIKID